MIAVVVILTLALTLGMVMVMAVVLKRENGIMLISAVSTEWRAEAIVPVTVSSTVDDSKIVKQNQAEAKDAVKATSSTSLHDTATTTDTTIDTTSAETTKAANNTNNNKSMALGILETSKDWSMSGNIQHMAGKQTSHGCTCQSL